MFGSRTMVQLDSVIGDVTPHTFDMRLPQQAFSMLCSLSHLQEQVVLDSIVQFYIFIQGTKLLNLIDQDMVTCLNYHVGL